MIKLGILVFMIVGILLLAGCGFTAPVDVCNDSDGDGSGSPAHVDCDFSELDCDDFNANINPSATEICGNGVDEDCDGVDEVCPVGSLYLVENGVGVADIVVASDAPNMVGLAADYFQMYIEDMTGVVLPVSNSPVDGKFHVYVGRSSYTDALGINSDGCKDGGFKMVSEENYLVLIGEDEPADFQGPSTLEEWDAMTGERWKNVVIEFYPRKDHNVKQDIYEPDDRGSMNAVFKFMYDQGLRLYHPGWHEYENFGSIIPQKQSISFEPVNKIVNPDFEARNIYHYGKKFGHITDSGYSDRQDDELQWILSLGLNSPYEFVVGYAGGWGHGIKEIVDRQTDRTEYFATVNGVSSLSVSDTHYSDVNFCFPYYTEENELFNETIRYAKMMFDTYDFPIVSIQPNDGFTTISDECKEKSMPEMGRTGILSNYIWEFVNNVAWEIYEDPNYEGKMIFNAAYGVYLLPPTNLSRPVAPNLVSMMAKARSNNANEETKIFYDGLTNDWIEFLASNNHLTNGVETNKFYTYDYYLYNDNRRDTRAIPIYFPHIISEDLKFLKGRSSGEFIEASTNAVWPPYDRPNDVWNLEWDGFIANSLNSYITSRLYWDADQDVDVLLDEYYDLFFGPASVQMKEFIEYSEANYEPEVYSPFYMDNMRTMANNALTMVDADSLYAHRIEFLLEMMNLDYVGEETFIDSCQTLNSYPTVYKLTNDVSSVGTCMIFDASGITLDCQGHTITYSTGGGTKEYGIFNDGFRSKRGDHFNITNCVIKDGSYLTGEATGAGIFLHNVDFGVVENTVINTSGTGIQVYNAVSNLYKNNEIYSYEGNSFYLQYSDSAASSDISSNIFDGNVFRSILAWSVYLYYANNDTLISNDVNSRDGFGVRLHGCENCVLKNNIISSDNAVGLSAYQSVNLTLIDNTITDGN